MQSNYVLALIILMSESPVLKTELRQEKNGMLQFFNAKQVAKH